MYCRGCYACPETGMRQKMRDGLQYQSQLVDTTKQLQRLVEGVQNGGLAAELRVQLDRLQTVTDGFKEHFSSCLDNSFYNERFGRTREATERFFDVPELLEHVMRYLPLDDLMRVQQVNKQLKAATEGSPRLRKFMLQQADPNGFFQTPLHLEGRRRQLRCQEAHHDHRAVRREPEVVVQAIIRDKVPRMGKRWLDMYTCQPPITEMRVYTWCCSNKSGNNSDVVAETTASQGTLTAPGGIRIGDLCTAAEPIFEKHRLCPNAGVHVLRPDGTVKVHVTFQGIAVLRDDDPFLAKRRERRLRSMKVRQETAARREHLSRYAQFKSLCECTRLYIPVLQY